MKQGIRQFIVGTGGKSLYRIDQIGENSVVRNNHTFGVLKLQLKENSYEWEFVPVEENDGFKELIKDLLLADFSDAGRGTCH